MKANKFVINGIIDDSKITEIKHSIRTNEGVNAVRIDIQSNTVTVDYDEARYSEGDIKDFVSQAGLNVMEVK